MCLSRRGFYKHTTVQKPHGCGKCQICQNQKARDVPFRRTHTDTQAGLGAPFLGCAHVELPLPFVRSTQPRFLLHLCLKTRFSTPINPDTFSRSQRNAHIRFKTVFFCGQLLGEDRCLAHFLSSIHEEERTNADVNTGNDTNKTENKPHNLHEMNL